MNNPYKKTTLPNGIRLITTPMKNTKAVTVLVLVACGSRYETQEINGISHFVEHMVFKGTKKYPKSLDVAKTLDALGAQYNAMTDKETTGFYAHVPAKHLDIALDVLSDFLVNPLFPKAEVEKERGVILEEIKMRNDMPMVLATVLLEKVLFGNVPLGWDIAGEMETVGGITHQKILDFVDKYYSNKSLVVSVAGDLGQADQKKIEEYFSSRTSGKPESFKPVATKRKPKALILNKKTEQSHLRLGIYGYNIYHKDYYVFEALGEILGGSMSSRLFEEVREKRGLAYYIQSGITSFRDAGYLGIYAGIAHEKVIETTEIIMNELKRIAEDIVSEEELVRNKERLKGQMILGFEDSFEVADFYGGQEVLDEKTKTLEEVLHEVEIIERKDILRVARDILKEENMNLALVGPEKDKNIFFKLMRI